MKETKLSQDDFDIAIDYLTKEHDTAVEHALDEDLPQDEEDNKRVIGGLFRSIQYLRQQKERNTFRGLLNSGVNIDCDIVIGGIEMNYAFCYDKEDVNAFLTPYGQERFKDILDSEYIVGKTDRFGITAMEILYDDEQLAAYFVRSAAGYVNDSIFRKIFK